MSSCEEPSELIAVLWSVESLEVDTGSLGTERSSVVLAVAFVTSHLNLRGDVLLFSSSWDRALNPHKFPLKSLQSGRRGERAALG